MGIFFRLYGLLAAVLLGSMVHVAHEPELTAQQPPAGDSVRIKEPVCISLVFGGDVMQHMPQVEAARRDTTFDYSGCFRHLEPFFDSADLVVLNLETTITENRNYSGYPQFASPPHLVKALKNSGVDVLVLANNHTADKGAYGIRTTNKVVGDNGILYTGAFSDSASYRENHPLVVDLKGVRFAILNYTYGLNGMPLPRGTIVNHIDTSLMAADIRLARSLADHTVVYIHWGTEYARRPDSWQKQLSDWMHSRGVEFVIGSHPHVVQPLETVTDTSGKVTGITAYSLGNLVSNQRKRYTDGGMLVRVNLIYEDSLPVKIEPEYMLSWVDISPIEGRKEYRILPTPVADTASFPDPAARKAYELFISDSRQLLSQNHGFREITSHAGSVPKWPYFPETDATAYRPEMPPPVVSPYRPVYYKPEGIETPGRYTPDTVRDSYPSIP